MSAYDLDDSCRPLQKCLSGRLEHLGDRKVPVVAARLELLTRDKDPFGKLAIRDLLKSHGHGAGLVPWTWSRRSDPDRAETKGSAHSPPSTKALSVDVRYPLTPDVQSRGLRPTTVKPNPTSCPAG
jgi:hypothetical protein